MATKPKLWLARGKPPSASAKNTYVISLGGPPEFNPSGWPNGYDNLIGEYCRQQFERITGIKLKPGEVFSQKPAQNTVVTGRGLGAALMTVELGYYDASKDETPPKAGSRVTSK